MMNSARARSAAFAALCALGPLLASPAAAEPSAGELQVARSLFEGAERDEDGGRWLEALDKLHKVATIKMTAGVRFHIALCEENAGHLAVALAEYTAAESLALREKNREVLESVKGPLAALRERVPELVIQVPAGRAVDVTLDGRPVAEGALGVAMPLDPGVHRIDARAPGHLPFAAEVRLAESAHETVVVALVERPAPAPLAPVVTPRAPPRSRVPALAATGGALALAGAGLAFFLAAGSTQDEAMADCRAQRGPCGDDTRAMTRTFDALALGSWIGAAGVSALAITLWAEPAEKTSRAAAPALVVGPAAVQLRGTF